MGRPIWVYQTEKWVDSTQIGRLIFDLIPFIANIGIQEGRYICRKAFCLDLTSFPTPQTRWNERQPR